ncbi:MAG: trypsin-like serine protease [Polyangiaceae bacterium]
MPSKLLSAAALFALAHGLVACGAEGSEPTDVVEQPVLGGTLSTEEENSVVEVISVGDSVTHTCTGTLLAPNLVITARHCVANFVDTPFTCTADGELTPGSQGGKIGTLLDPSRISVRVGPKPSKVAAATGVKVFAAQGPSICRNDIALVVLDTMLTEPISPVRLGAGNERGEQIHVSGYGISDNKTIGTRYSRSGLIITQIGSSQFRTEGDPIPARTFVTEGPVLCSGDSGGPAFTELNAVTGVWSQVVGDCTANSARNFFTQVAPFESELLGPAFAEAGAQPWLEGTTGPGAGSGGSTGTAGAPSEGGAAETGGSASGGTASGGVTASGGLDANGGVDASGGSNASGGVEIRGPRKKGGCTCSTPGSESAGSAWPALAPVALGMLWRRRRAQRARSV